MQVNEYRGTVPDTNDGDVLHFSGEDKRGYGGDRTFEQYLRRTPEGYDVALLTEDGGWVHDNVTLKYAPNPTFYQEYRRVGPNEFPE